MDYKKIHKFSIYNRTSINKSEKCGCFYCESIYQSKEILEWIDADESGIGQTALCPKCGVDSVLGDNDIEIKDEVLKKMKEYWF